MPMTFLGQPLQSVQVSFIYHFLLAPEAANPIGTPSIGGYASSHRHWEKEGTADRDEYFVPPFVHMEPSFVFFEAEKEELIGLRGLAKDKSNWHARACAKLYPGGAGVFRLNLCFRSPAGTSLTWTTDEILAALDAPFQEHDRLPSSLVGTLYDRFRKFVYDLSHAANRAWLDYVGVEIIANGVRRQPLVFEHPQRPHQYPYPILILQFDHDSSPAAVYSEIDDLVRLVKRYTHSPDLDHLYDDGLVSIAGATPRLYNLNGNQEVFFNFSFKGAVLLLFPPLTSPDGSAADVRLYTTEALELVRSRWYVFGMLSAWLDVWAVELAQRASAIRRLPRASPTSSAPLLAELERITEIALNTRVSIMRLLQAPLVHEIGTASVNEIEDRAREVFQLDDLAATFRIKLDLIDRIYRDFADIVESTDIQQRLRSHGLDRVHAPDQP